MKHKINTFILILLIASISFEISYAKQVALSFDDAPRPSTLYFESKNRTTLLIEKLKKLNVKAMVFANPCNGDNVHDTIEQLKLYKNEGHIIGNHTCSHPRLDKIGESAFKADILKADELLLPLFEGQKYFRFPYLNEGTDPLLRNNIRNWLKENKYENASISGDNEDPTFSSKINEAKKRGLVIDYGAVRTLFVDHIVSSLECNDKLAIQAIGRSPKHVLLLHEADATIMFIDALVDELRKRHWEIIDPLDAYNDPLYKNTPKNTHSGFGIVAQVAFEKTGKKHVCYDYKDLVKNLNKTLHLN